jgi:hypothetical protein
VERENICRQFFLSTEYIDRLFVAIGKKPLDNWSQAIPTIELSRTTVMTAKEQNLRAIESFADQRVEK